MYITITQLKLPQYNVIYIASNRLVGFFQIERRKFFTSSTHLPFTGLFIPFWNSEFPSGTIYPQPGEFLRVFLIPFVY